jgi:alpha-tubulin suppressor-like RCC1 family protein
MVCLRNTCISTLHKGGDDDDDDDEDDDDDDDDDDNNNNKSAKVKVQIFQRGKQHYTRMYYKL